MVNNYIGFYPAETCLLSSAVCCIVTLSWRIRTLWVLEIGSEYPADPLGLQLDVSRRIVDWTIKKGWGLLDVDIFAKPRVPNKRAPTVSHLRRLHISMVQQNDVERQFLLRFRSPN